MRDLGFEVHRNQAIYTTIKEHVSKTLPYQSAFLKATTQHFTGIGYPINFEGHELNFA